MQDLHQVDVCGELNLFQFISLVLVSVEEIKVTRSEQTDEYDSLLKIL